MRSKIRAKAMTSALCVSFLAASGSAFAQAAPPTDADPANEIVVRGELERLSSWKRAETDHAIIYSNGSETRLRNAARELEALHYLLGLVFSNPDAQAATEKPVITLVESDDFMRSMNLVNWRGAEGPFGGPIQDQRYYDPRIAGAVMAVSRTNLFFSASATANVGQTNDFFAFETGNAIDDVGLDDDSGLGDSGFDDGGFNEPGGADFFDDSGGDQERPWEQAMFAGYAQHYVTTHLPNAYPRWYIDSIGALFSTARVNDAGELEFGRSPPAFRGLWNSSEDPDIAELLTAGEAAEGLSWSSAQAWLVGHFFFLHNRNAARKQQLAQYMGAIANGRTPREAAVVFGDLEELQNEIERYGDRRTRFAKVDAPDLAAIDVNIQPMRMSDAALLDERLALDARLILPPTPAADDADAASLLRSRERAADMRDRWLAELRSDVTELPGNAEALLLLAEVECRTGNFSACETAANAVLAEYPYNTDAMSWKAIAQVNQALTAPADQRQERIASARSLVLAANRADPDAILPLVAYFRSFTDSGAIAPEAALLGMVKVIQTVPNAPEPRVMLARELERQDRQDAAQAFLLPVVAGPWDSPERREVLGRQ